MECPAEDNGSGPTSPTPNDSHGEPTATDMPTGAESGAGQTGKSPAEYEVATPTMKRENTGENVGTKDAETVSPPLEKESPPQGLPTPSCEGTDPLPGGATPTKPMRPVISPKPKVSQKPKKTVPPKASGSGGSPKVWHSGRNTEVKETEVLAAVSGGVSGKAGDDGSRVELQLPRLEGGREGEGGNTQEVREHLSTFCFLVSCVQFSTLLFHCISILPPLPPCLPAG